MEEIWRLTGITFNYAYIYDLVFISVILLVAGIFIRNAWYKFAIYLAANVIAALRAPTTETLLFSMLAFFLVMPGAWLFNLMLKRK